MAGLDPGLRGWQEIQRLAFMVLVPVVPAQAETQGFQLLAPGRHRGRN
jgi:hypothetical protein